MLRGPVLCPLWCVVMAMIFDACGATLPPWATLLGKTAALGQHSAQDTITNMRHTRSGAVVTDTVTHPVAATSSTPIHTTTSTSTGTTTTTTAAVGCGGVARCLDHTQCAQCLEAINSTTGFAHSIADYNSLDTAAIRAYNIGFFQALQLTASCSTDVTPPNILHPALQELYDVNLCIDTYGMAVSTCLLAEYVCFADTNCRQCLAAVHAAAAAADDGNTSNGTKAAALRTPACTALTATNTALLNALGHSCGGSSFFPACTFRK